MKSGGFHEIRMKSGGFHEIRRISGEIQCRFQVKSTPNLEKSEEFFLKHLQLISETSDFTWNLPDFMDFMKSARFHGFHEIQWISWNLYEIRQISGEIHPKPCKIRRVFAETSAADFWNIWFHLKSTRFHGEICQISWISWNLPDFMKSARFHGEIHQISWWNLPDFMNVSFWVMIKYRSFYWKTNQMFQQNLFWLVFQKMKDLYLIIMQKLIILKSGGFHEIWQISCGFKSSGFHEILGHIPHPAFIKLKSFCWNTCFIILGGFHRWKSGWNPPDFMVEIHQISGWNPLDF